MNRTRNALAARGIDSATMSRLIDSGWTLAKLKATTPDALRSLGLSSAAVATIAGEGRPPIPTDIVTQVLFANRFQCCVCRDPDRPIILHHIVEWEDSHDHSAANLAVLCLDHHDRAHSRSKLSRNLDASTLRALKREWEEECRHADLASILQASRIDYDAWLYFNHTRLFELTKRLKIKLRDVDGYADALASRLIDANGLIRPRNPAFSYMYDTAAGSTVYHYVRAVLDEALEHLAVINLSDLLDRSNVHALVAAGDFLLVQGAHNFKRLTDRTSGKDEAMQGTRRVNDVELRFSFDRWEATSSSAWSTWLSGRQSVASLVHVKDVFREDGTAVIAATVLAISNGHQKLQRRSYSPRFARYILEEDDETDENPL